MYNNKRPRGVSERFKVQSWKGCVGAIPPWVRIPSPLYWSPVAECDRTPILYKPRKQASLRLVFCNDRLQMKTKYSLLRPSITKSLRSRCRRWNKKILLAILYCLFEYIYIE